MLTLLAVARAAEAWKAGDGAAARQWSAEGQALNARVAEEQRLAVGVLLSDRHAALRERLIAETVGAAQPSDEGGARALRGQAAGAGLGLCLGVAPRGVAPQQTTEERTEFLLDLHALHAAEATAAVERFLLGLEAERRRGIAYLAVGSGRHTSTDTDRRRVGLSQAVRAWLAGWAYVSRAARGVEGLQLTQTARSHTSSTTACWPSIR